MPEHKIGTREEWQAARDELAKLEGEQAQRNEEIGGRFGRDRSLAFPQRTNFGDALLIVAEGTVGVVIVLGGIVVAAAIEPPSQQG